MDDPKSLYREALEIIAASTTIPLYRDFEQGASIDDLQSGVRGLLEWISLRTGPDAPALQSARELLEALGQLGEEDRTPPCRGRKKRLPRPSKACYRSSTRDRPG